MFQDYKITNETGLDAIIKARTYREAKVKAAKKFGVNGSQSGLTIQRVKSEAELKAIAEAESRREFLDRMTDADLLLAANTAELNYRTLAKQLAEAKELWEMYGEEQDDRAMRAAKKGGRA